jgi:hypothetical protein
MSSSLSVAPQPPTLVVAPASPPSTSGRVEAVVLPFPSPLADPPPEDTLARYIGASLGGFLVGALSVLAYLTVTL